MDALTALQTLEVIACVIKQLLPLNGLTALQLISLDKCSSLQQLPPLDCLIALKHLELRECETLLGTPLRLPSSQGSRVSVYGVYDGTRVLQGEHLIE
jgi:hypothetical protein